MMRLSMWRVWACLRSARVWKPGVALLLALTFVGCTSSRIESEEAADIQRVAVVTYLEDDDGRIFDRTGSQVDTGTEVAAGLLGGAIGGAIVGGVEAALNTIAIERSLGGDPAPLVDALRDAPIAPVLDRGVTAGLGDLPTLSPLDLEHLGVADAPERTTSDGVRVHDYRSLMDRWDIDTVIEIRLQHGLAVYADDPARPAVVADVYVVDVVEDRVIMKSSFSAEDTHQRGHHIAELAADGAALYRQEVEAASGILGARVRAEFIGVSGSSSGMSISSAGDSLQAEAVAKGAVTGPEFRQAISAWSLSCSEPVALDRDCSSWSGPTREVELDGMGFNVAGSADGRHVLVMQLSTLSALKLRVDEESRRAYLALRRLFQEHGVGIKVVTPVETSGKRIGYLLELDGDGYDILVDSRTAEE